MALNREKPWLFVIDSCSGGSLDNGPSSEIGVALEAQAASAGYEALSPLPKYAGASIEDWRPDAVVAYVAEPTLGVSSLEEVYRALKCSRALGIPYALVKDPRRFINKFILESADVIIENNGPAAVAAVDQWLTSLSSTTHNN